jgi:SAM-dependent methyltransferase
MPEDFQPVSNTPPEGLKGKTKFYGRMVLDLQVLTVYRDLRRVLPSWSGNVLDVGCGESPYRFLLDRQRCQYRGIDIADASKFARTNPDVTAFDGKRIPFANDTFDAVLCTEVLEHVPGYADLVTELHRVLKPGGKGIITVPWSARVHYAPYDYFRYTPSTLKSMFEGFRESSIKARGTDWSTIASKIVVLFFRGLVPRSPLRWLWVPVWLLLSPLLLLALLAGHAGVWLGIGSDDDPLGYTIEVTK